MSLFDKAEDTVRKALVAFKKKNGMGYITTKRLAWVEAGKAELSLSVPLDSIKSRHCAVVTLTDIQAL